MVANRDLFSRFLFLPLLGSGFFLFLFGFVFPSFALVILVAVLTLAYGGFSLKKKEKQLRSLEKKVAVDEITGLQSWSVFQTRGEELLESKRTGEGKLSLGIIDLDNFKRWNNLLGPLGGDELLKKVAGFLADKLSQEDLIARWHGDKFIFLFPGASGKWSGSRISKILEELRQKSFFIREVEIKVEACAGIAHFPDDGESIPDLILAADSYLRRAQKVGRRVCSAGDGDPRLEVHNSIKLHNPASYQDRIAKKSTQLCLLFKERDLEIIKQKIAANKAFCIEKPEGEYFYEFYYILSGEIKQLDSGETLTTGSFITPGNLEASLYFETLTPVSLLFVTNAPVFKQQSDELEKWARMIEELEGKDQRIEIHGFRLEEMAIKLGKEMGLKEEALFALAFAAYLHDIGKTRIPSSILQKKGPLTYEEWETIKKHPGWSREMIRENLQHNLSEKIAEIVYQHHERYDGTGYPRGLKGDEIMLEAQIVALLDAFDAITSERPYQAAFSKEEAKKEILRCKGTQFSPTLVETFIPLIDELEEDKKDSREGREVY